MFYIYIIFNLINGKIYVGKSNSKRRWKTHLNTARSGPEVYKKSFSLIHKAIRKYGENNFDFKIIQHVTEKEVKSAERYWIDFYKTNVWKFGNNFGYNLTQGGEGWEGHHHTDDTKNKLRILKTGLKASLETKVRMSESHKGLIVGSKNPRVKLNEENVKSIKRLIKNGDNNRTIAAQFRVHHATISAIRTGKLWSHITE